MGKEPDMDSVREAMSTIAHELGDITDFEIRYSTHHNGDVYIQIETAQPITGVDKSPTNKYTISGSCLSGVDVVTIQPNIEL